MDETLKQFDGHYMVFRLSPKKGQSIQDRLSSEYMPTRAYKSRDTAEKCAAKLATKIPNTSFIVVHIVSRAKK